MKPILSLIFLILAVSITNSTHLRTTLQHEQLPFLNNMNPIQIAQLMSGDYISILPASIQPIVRSVLGQQQQSGVSGFLSQAQNLLSGGNNPSNSGGLLGGMGSLFGQSSQQGTNGLGSLLGSFSNAFGGSSNPATSSMMGLPSGFNLGSLTGALPMGGQQGGALSGLTSLFGHE
jgi:hypothetical protein